MKKCPFCAEEIKDEAIKCKSCGSDLLKSSFKPNSNKIQGDSKNLLNKQIGDLFTTKKSKVIAIIIFSIIIVGTWSYLAIFTYTQKQIPKEAAKVVPQISNEEKNLAIQSIKGYPEVRDAAVTQKGVTLSLAIIVNYGTPKEKAKERGEDFLRMVKSFSKDEKPTDKIGEGIYDYLVGVYYPDETIIDMGAKVRGADKLSW